MLDFSVEQFMTVAEVADTLKLNQQTVRNWIDDGKLPAVRVGRRVRVLRSDFEQLVSDGYSPGRTHPGPAEPDAAPGRGFWEGDLSPEPASFGETEAPDASGHTEA